MIEIGINARKVQARIGVNADLKLTRFSGGCRLKTDTPLSH